MKHLSDGFLVLLIALIVWGVSFFLTALLAGTVLPSALVATALTAVLLVLWVAGRRTSLNRERQRRRDIEIVAEYSDCIENKKLGAFIYDVSELPHSKDEILSALFRLVEDDPSKFFLMTYASFAPTLANFQPGVGETPITTFIGAVSNTLPLVGEAQSIDQVATLIATREKTAIEEQVDRERELILAKLARGLS